MHLTPPRSSSGSAADVQTGAKFPEHRCGKAFCEDIGILRARGNMKNSDFSKCHAVTNEVKVDLHVLGPLMLNWVGGEIDRTYVVAEHDGGTAKRSMKFVQELTEPAGFGDGISNNTIFCLSAGARHCLLSFRGPGDEIVAEEHTVARGGGDPALGGDPTGTNPVVVVGAAEVVSAEG